MSIHIAIHHITTYKFDRMTTLYPHQIRLRPAPHCRTPVLSYSLKIEPAKHFINWQQDAFGNYIARLVFLEPARELRVEVDLTADMTVINPFDFFLEEDAEEIPFEYDPEEKVDLAPCLERAEDGPLLTEWLKGVDRTPRRTIDFLVDLNQRLNKDIRYLIRMEPGVQSCEETLEKRSGSCRDSAWLLAQILRRLGFAARFVSGYIVQLTADVKSLDGPSGPEADFTDLHAWTEVYLPGAGWIGMDPTSGLFAGEGHIPLACAPHPTSAGPIEGATGKCEVQFSFQNSVTRIHEDPRVTKPYTESEWREIDALGRRIDGEMASGDIRLTMGGEPTFVSIDNMDSPEWNTAALGAEKKQKAADLLVRLKERFAPKGLLFHGQGKWYPGEELPRWAFACYWRKDGVPVWNEPLLSADPSKPGVYGLPEARRFIEHLARALGVPQKSIIDGFEDVYYYLWKEGTLPVNIDPLKHDLKDSMERKRLARLLEKGLDKIAGFAMPLKWDFGGRPQRWIGDVWEFKRGRMYLIPGDSPMGYRLPLDSLPWTPPERIPPEPEASPFEPRPPLEDYRQRTMKRTERRDGAEAHFPRERIREQTGGPGGGPDDGEPYRHLVRTALCVEPRGGNLHIFLPPIPRLEPFLDLAAAIERTADRLNIPVVIEGYPPVGDPRLENFKITPDPGVIEVNLQPAFSWEEMTRNTEILYEEAYYARLGTEKFMLDGRHTGTGGGNHVTVGGETPSDSPFLRNPKLLKSMLTYWQHHPSLSYLFSGLFIGPTSQMPRVDEARDENLYELEIAFQQLPDGPAALPWKVDRALRNHLTDMTGNTHRSEFSIDKLYSPDSHAGRQGLVEIRGFEMPPHARMSMAQMLLLRALIARFWRSPYEHPLARWGTELHDRFMLPHYVWNDFLDVLDDLAREGFEMRPEWFAPFYEFRFPRYGTVQVGDIGVELRMALEPWHVLGEEATAAGTSRYVDSSTERLQVKISGMTGSRHVIACNGRRVPLRATGTRGEFVSGVRYRAWDPPSALHPGLGIHTPLIFDVIDLWSGRSVGGCTYHAAHPGGRGYETFPVNAYEAESRRVSRFWSHGHTPGPCSPPAETVNPEYPYVLDLRRADERFHKAGQMVGV